MQLGYYYTKYTKLSTYFCLPKIGESPIMTEARADFTCWLASATNSLIHGRMLFIITCSWISVGKFWQKSGRNIYIQIQKSHLNWNLKLETSSFTAWSQEKFDFWQTDTKMKVSIHYPNLIQCLFFYFWTSLGFQILHFQFQ